ncbi:MAG: GNAT family N-acetyltransferase, partial [Actinomycetota bacterium]|nr:GNAT family N-acetyltransferase [Actinomycetota bacterium]
MLEADHVRLRPLSREDVPILWEYWSDLDVATRASNEPPKPLTLEETRDLFDELGKRDDLVRFAIEADGELVGSCTLHSIDKHNR